jgi:hypothetical protein
MRNHALTDELAKSIIHDCFASGLMPLRLFPVVSRLYFDDEAQAEKFPERTLWSLNNAATEALKLLKPAPQQSCGLGMGRMFCRLVHRPRTQPIAVIDGIEVWG